MDFLFTVIVDDDELDAMWRPIRSQAILRNLQRHAIRRSYHADVLPSLISTSTPEFTAKADAMDALVGDLELKLADARLGGGEKAAERMRGKGKMLPRERYIHPVCFF